MNLNNNYFFQTIYSSHPGYAYNQQTGEYQYMSGYQVNVINNIELKLHDTFFFLTQSSITRMRYKIAIANIQMLHLINKVIQQKVVISVSMGKHMLTK